METTIKRFSLLTLLLVIAIFGLSLAIRLERTRKPEVYFLHIYSTQYRANGDVYHPEAQGKNEPPWGTNVRLATVGVCPGIPFHIDVPNNYLPTIRLNGQFISDGTNISGSFKIEVESPGDVFNAQHSSAFQIDDLQPFWDGYYLAVSKSADPYSLDYNSVGMK